MRWIKILAVLLLLQQNIVAQGIAPTVKRIVFLGNSITWAGNYVNDVAAYVQAMDSARQLTFINVGLSSETVSGLSEAGHAGGSFPRPDLHERLDRVLAQIKPDVVFACYGMNDGIYMPFSEGRFQKFKDGINWLHHAVVETGAQIIHLTPPFYDEQKGGSKGYGAVLDRYSDWLLDQKRSANWTVIDIHYPMKNYVAAHRKVDAQYGLADFTLAQDGVHPGELGHWMIARKILTYLGYRAVEKSPSIIQSLSHLAKAEQYVQLVGQRQNLMRDAWLTATGHKRPGLPTGLPLSEAREKAAEIDRAITQLVQQKK